MVKALYYPPANRTAQWFGKTYSGAEIDADKLVWHTTETGGWPGYRGGASAPHWTYHADIHQWRQHFPANRSARALRNAAGGVQTNTDDALQVEIIAYSDEGLAVRRRHLPVSQLDDEALQDLADFAVWARDEWGVPLELADDWTPVAAGSLRFSFAEWRAFRGHCGHIHVPENTHWDPAALRIHEIMRRARSANQEDDMTPDESKTLYYLEQQNKAIAGAVAYVSRQCKSIGAAIGAEATALADGEVDPAELRTVLDKIAGKG